MKSSLAIGLALVLWTFASPVGAQGRVQRVQATVVLVEALPHPSAEYVIQRRVGMSPSDVILLSMDADAAALSDAVRALLIARQAGGDTATTPATIRVRPQSGRVQRRLMLPWAPRVMSDLRSALPRNVSGIGAARAVDIWLPRQTRRR